MPKGFNLVFECKEENISSTEEALDRNILDLCLNGLRSVKNLKLPIEIIVYLTSIERIEGLVLYQKWYLVMK